MVNSYEAGGGNTLSVVRHGWDTFTQHEREATEQIMPGQVVTPTVTAGDETYELAAAGGEVAYHVAIEARGRGMDANTDDGYPVEDMVKAVKPAGGEGLRLMLANNETVTEGAALVVDGSGNVAQYVSADDDKVDIIGYAAEDLDLSPGSVGASLLAVNMED